MRMLTAFSPLLLMAADARFPALEANDLNGRQIAMPGGFAGERNLVLVAFLQKQQKDVDTWLAPLAAVQQAHPGFRYYELPTIKRMNGLMRFIIANGMRGGIPDKGQRERTITLHIDKEPFKKALGIESESTIHALLIDKAGQVLWRAEGLYTAAKGESLVAMLDTWRIKGETTRHAPAAIDRHRAPGPFSAGAATQELRHVLAASHLQAAE